MKLFFTSLCIFILSAGMAIGKEFPLLDSIASNTKFHLSGGLLKINIGPDNYSDINQSDYLNLVDSYSKANDETIIQKGGRDLSYNSPFYHASSWVRTGFEFNYAGFTIKPDLILEHRAQSWGIFDKNSLNVIPMIHFAYDSSINFLGDKLQFGLSLGTYENLKTMEGLTLYNMDLQGFNIYFKSRGFKLWFQNISDLLGSYGLGINDLFQLGIGLENFDLFSGLKMDIKASANYYYEIMTSSDEIFFSYMDFFYEYDELKDYSFGFSAACYNDVFRLYSELGIRTGEKINLSSYFGDFSRNIDIMERMAFLLGAEYTIKTESFELNTGLEYRYYGNYFNSGLISVDNAQYGENETGNIYPLYMIDKPFSQWAVYSEYQDRKVSCYTLKANAGYNFIKDFNINASLDLNWIDASGIDAFLYPFQTYGISYEPLEETYLMLGVTNKTFNQNKHYPTLYALKNLQGFFTLRFNF